MTKLALILSSLLKSSFIAASLALFPLNSYAYILYYPHSFQMLQLMKDLIARRSRAKGVLSIQGTEYPDAVASVVKDKLVFEFRKKIEEDSSKSEKLEISLSEIKEAAESNKTLSLIFQGKKYLFKTDSAGTLYSKLATISPKEVLFRDENATYYTFSVESRTFVLHSEPVRIEIYLEDEYYMQVTDSQQVLYTNKITTDIQYYADQDNMSFVWSVFRSGSFHTFCLRFKSHISFLEFRSKYLQCSYKSNTGEVTFDEMYQEMGEYTPSTETKDEESEEWREYEEETVKSNEFNRVKLSNRNLVVGDSQCFVTRGESLGVFNLKEDGVEFKTQIKNAVKDPLKVMSHSGERRLVILEKDIRDRLELLDLSRGEVVEKWDVKTRMNDCFDALKTDNNGDLIGVSDYSIFRIDPRTKEKVVAKKEYKMKNEFSCGIASKPGNIAIASSKGDLRLYNKLDKRAKSLIPGFGDSITGIDASRDGSLVLCTCKNYILLFELTSDYSKHCKPVPRRLQLQPEHLVYLDEDVKFTTAKFDKNDTLIITSAGRYVIEWRVKDVLDGGVYSYSLRALSDRIVDEDFVINGSDVVVALENDVKKIGESELKRPGKRKWL